MQNYGESHQIGGEGGARLEYFRKKAEKEGKGGEESELKNHVHRSGGRPGLLGLEWRGGTENSPKKGGGKGQGERKEKACANTLEYPGKTEKGREHSFDIARLANTLGGEHVVEEKPSELKDSIEKHCADWGGGSPKHGRYPLKSEAPDVVVLGVRNLFQKKLKEPTGKSMNA